MKTKKFLFYVLAALLGGCIPVMSLHPLFTEETLVFEEKLLGTWVDDSNNIWEFKDSNEQEKIYKLIFVDNKGKKGSFEVHLVKLENRLFLDVFPNQFPSGQQDWEKMNWPYNFFFFESAHTFIKINGIEPELKLQLTDDDELKKLLKKDPNAVEHTLVYENKLVLTASTKELQAFVLKYANDSRVFTAGIVLTRKETKSPQPSPEKGPNEVPKGK